MAIPLEDNFADIIGKAQRGLKLADSDLAAKAGIAQEILHRLKSGEFEAAAARSVAGPLGLNPAALVEIGERTYAPAEIGAFDGLAQFNTVFDDMTVNAYLVWDPASKEAAAFDTGSDCGPILEKAASEGLTIRTIFLTHTHGDHVFDLDRLLQKTGAPAFVSSREPIDGAESFEAGREFAVGTLKRPLAIVGDALFAGSMGGGMASYQDALKTNLASIYSLPDETIVCPGHGPMTSVGEEKKHNPFFAA